MRASIYLASNWHIYNYYGNLQFTNQSKAYGKLEIAYFCMLALNANFTCSIKQQQETEFHVYYIAFLFMHAWTTYIFIALTALLLRFELSSKNGQTNLPALWDSDKKKCIFYTAGSNDVITAFNYAWKDIINYKGVSKCTTNPQILNNNREKIEFFK